MSPIARVVDVSAWRTSQSPGLLAREWLITNGLGGYASGTVVGSPTRRYHGLLIAALPAPWGRMMSLAHVHEVVAPTSAQPVALASLHRPGCDPELGCVDLLSTFRLRAGLPEWEYALPGVVLTKSIYMPHEQNTVHVSYLLSGGHDNRLDIRLIPLVHFRPHNSEVDEGRPGPYEIEPREGVVSCSLPGDPGAAAPLPPLRMLVTGAESPFKEEHATEEVYYQKEDERGYPAAGLLWKPGYFDVELRGGDTVTLIVSMEPWMMLKSVSPDEMFRAEKERRAALVAAVPEAEHEPFAAELVLASDQFLISPVSRPADEVRARASGQESHSVIAGYHWFTEWGRDTMISLEGLCLVPRRPAIAEGALRVFAQYLRDGLIPNLFPEGDLGGIYHTADATLWFFHALSRYTAYTGNRDLLRHLLPALNDILERHFEGTRFGIAVDPADGLLRQGSEGYALTWMDAKVGDWVVTPRRGKAVEINALWYNALRLMAGWLKDEGQAAAAARAAAAADRVYASFNERFWHEEGGYLYDVIDGPEGLDPSCRPNQIFALSLPNPVLDERHWNAVLEVVRARLLTPVGLRTLAPGSPDYKRVYSGDVRSRDAAYHQGTVWPWLIGPFVDAWLRVHPKDLTGARELLSGFSDHLQEACVGSISEIVDAEAPFAPRGCIAQAWSVAEVLRSWVKTGLDEEVSSDG